jgi:hypothetical protein
MDSREHVEVSGIHILLVTVTDRKNVDGLINMPGHEVGNASFPHEG